MLTSKQSKQVIRDYNKIKDRLKRQSIANQKFVLRLSPKLIQVMKEHSHPNGRDLIASVDTYSLDRFIHVLRYYEPL